MTDVRRVTLLAAALWVALHLTDAVLHADKHREPVLLAVGMGLAVLIALASLDPLVLSEPPELTPLRGAALVLAATVMVLCVHPFLTPAGLTGYANWPMGEVGVLVATLVMCNCLWGAYATTVVVVASNAVAMRAAHDSTPSVGWVEVLFLSTLPLTWLLGSLAVRSVLRRGEVLREEYVRRGFGLADEEQLRLAVRAADVSRRRELRSRLEPLLHRVEEEGATSRLRTEARLAADDLRDVLRARSLLNGPLREQISDARARGVRVTVSSAPGPAEHEETALVVRTRELLEVVLPDVELGTAISCRTTRRPAVSLLLVRAPTERETARVRAVLDGALRSLPDADVIALLEEHDGELLLELRPHDQGNAS